MKKITLLVCSYLIAGVFSLFAQTWEKMANIPVALSFPVVVELNGNIHVMGGGGPSGATNLHLRYKPATNTWDTMANVPYFAQQPAGAVVNGKIHYFGGGFPNTGTRLDKHYVYNPDSNTWAAAASLPQARAIMEAAAVGDKLYSLGGQADKSLNEMYNSLTNTWSTKNTLPDQNFWYSTVVVNNGIIYRFGGGGYTAPSASAHKYDAISDTWTALPALPQALHALAGTSYGHFIFLTGGYNSLPSDKVWLFDVNTNTYIAGTPLPSARNYHDMVTAGNCIYSLGGSNNADATVPNSLWRYCPAGNVSVNESNMNSAQKITVSRTNQQIILNLEALNLNSPSKLTLFDITGKKMSEQTTTQKKVTFDMSIFPIGFYFVQIQIEGETFTLKVQ